MDAPDPVSVGLVITLSSTPGAGLAVRRALATLPDFELGAFSAHWIAAAATTADPRALHRHLENLPGVAHVDVVFVEMARVA